MTPQPTERYDQATVTATNIVDGINEGLSKFTNGGISFQPSIIKKIAEGLRVVFAHIEAKAVARYKAESDPQPTTERPTEEGWYWLWTHSNIDWKMVKIDAELFVDDGYGSLGHVSQFSDYCQWLRILPPASPSEKKESHSTPYNKSLGHGHVTRRPDGVKVRCGGPGICIICNAEASRKIREQAEKGEL